MTKRRRCHFCTSDATYRTEAGTPFCRWHTLILYFGYHYVGEA